MSQTGPDATPNVDLVDFLLGRLVPQQPVQGDPAEDDEEAAAASVHRPDGETLHG